MMMEMMTRDQIEQPISRVRACPNAIIQSLTPAPVDDRDALKEKMDIFKKNVFDSRLKTHKLKGNLKEYLAFSINYSDRIVFRILEDEGVYFIEIGDHDTCY